MSAAKTVERDRLVDRNGWALGWLAAYSGVAIIASHIESGATRFGHSWYFALQVPGSPATWGVVILIAGLLLLGGCWRNNRCACHAGASIGFAWFCAIDATSLLAFIEDLLNDDPVNAVNPLSMGIWTLFAWMYGARRRYTEKRFDD